MSAFASFQPGQAALLALLAAAWGCAGDTVQLSPDTVTEQALVGTTLTLEASSADVFATLDRDQVRARRLEVTVGGESAEVLGLQAATLTVRPLVALPPGDYPVIVSAGGRALTATPSLSVIRDPRLDGGMLDAGVDHGASDLGQDGGQDLGPDFGGVDQGLVTEFDLCALITPVQSVVYGCYSFDDSDGADGSPRGNDLITDNVNFPRRALGDPGSGRVLGRGNNADARTPTTISTTGQRHTIAASVNTLGTLGEREAIITVDGFRMTLTREMNTDALHCAVGAVDLVTPIDNSRLAWIHYACRVQPDPDLGAGNILVDAFVDGVKVNSVTAAGTLPDYQAPFFIGQEDASGDAGLRGGIDDVVLAEDALSDDMICQLSRRTPPCL